MEELRHSVTPLLPHLGQLADLHVYLVPVESWVPSQKLWFNYVIHEAVSYGFVRVQTQVNLHDLRAELEEQLDNGVLPENYVFLRSVGRNFARVKEKQEFQLKVRDFMPPNASEPELYLLESTPELEVIIQTVGRAETKQVHSEADKSLTLKIRCCDGGDSRSVEVTPRNALPSLPFPTVNGGVSSPSAVVNAHSPTVLPPVSSSGQYKVTSKVNNKNRATSSSNLVDPSVKFPRIEANGQVASGGRRRDRPKSEPRNPHSHARKPPSSSRVSPTRKSVAVSGALPDYKAAASSVNASSRSRIRKGSSGGRRVSVVANVLKNKRHSAILSHQRIAVNNGHHRRRVARGTDLSDVAEECEPVKSPMRVEEPRKIRHASCYGCNVSYRSSNSNNKYSSPPYKSKSSPNRNRQNVAERAVSIGPSVRVLSTSPYRPMSTIDVRSAEKAAILKYELTVSELKKLRHAACHTSEKTARPIVARRTRPIPRTVWYPRPLHEGGNPPPLPRKIVSSRRRARAVRDSGHVYYTSSESKGFKKVSLKKKKSRVFLQGANGTLRRVSPKTGGTLTLQSIEVSPVAATNKRAPYSRNKRRKKTEFQLPRVEVEKKVEVEVDVYPPTVVEGGCCEWVIDNVSLEEFTNNEDHRKQVLQPIRKAALEKAKRQADAKRRESVVDGGVVARCDASSPGTVVLCSVDRPR